MNDRAPSLVIPLTQTSAHDTPRGIETECAAHSTPVLWPFRTASSSSLTHHRHLHRRHDLQRAEAELGPAAWWSFESFLYAWNTVQARAFGRRLPWSALVPFADTLNHTNVATKYDFNVDDNDAFRLFPSGTNSYGQGAEIFNSYGRRYISVCMCVCVCVCTRQASSRASVMRGVRLSRVRCGVHPHPRPRPRARFGPRVHRPDWPTQHRSRFRRANDNLLLEYGFAMMDNEWDVYDMRLVADPKDELWHPRRKLLARLGISTVRPTKIRRGEFCSDLLVICRVLNMSEGMLRRALPDVPLTGAAVGATRQLGRGTSMFAHGRTSGGTAAAAAAVGQGGTDKAADASAAGKVENGAGAAADGAAGGAASGGAGGAAGGVGQLEGLRVGIVPINASNERLALDEFRRRIQVGLECTFDVLSELFGGPPAVSTRAGPHGHTLSTHTASGLHSPPAPPRSSTHAT